MNLIEFNKIKLIEFCEKFNVKLLYLFGSYVRHSESETSDIDFVVFFNLENENFDYFDNYMSLKESLEILFDKKVELVEGQAIKNPIFQQAIDKDKLLIYGKVA